MGSYKIIDVDSLIYLCIPSEKRNDQLFIEGAKAKRRWAKKSLDMFGGIAKMAYMESKPIGLIQYQPKLNLRSKTTTLKPFSAIYI